VPADHGVCAGWLSRRSRARLRLGWPPGGGGAEQPVFQDGGADLALWAVALLGRLGDAVRELFAALWPEVEWTVAVRPVMGKDSPTPASAVATPGNSTGASARNANMITW
jgi:hypothetical protein